MRILLNRRGNEGRLVVDCERSEEGRNTEFDRNEIQLEEGMYSKCRVSGSDPASTHDFKKDPMRKNTAGTK